MRSDVITRHAIRNYGSLLQTIATRELLSGAGFDVRVIDYRQPGYDDSGWSYASRGSARDANIVFRLGYAAVRAPGTRRIGRMFESTLRNEIRLTEQTYRSLDELRDSSEFSDETFYCVGSDQVWNIEYNIDNSPYYLDFAPPSATKFSLASSIGASRLPPPEEARLVSALSSFASVSVREAEAARYLRSLGIDAEHHVDPTLAVDPSFWRSFAADPRAESEFILVYQLSGSERFDAVLAAVAEAMKMPVKRIEYWRGPRSFKGASVILPQLHEFVGLFRDASFVVTDSFHGTVFSMIFGTRFIAVPPPRYSERISSLLDVTGEQARLVSKPRDAVEVAHSQSEVVAAEPLLAGERRRVASYLDVVAGSGRSSRGSIGSHGS